MKSRFYLDTLAYVERIMLRDKALLEFRHTYYSLLRGLLWKEPSSELIAALQDDLESRIEAALAVQPRMGEGWQVIQQFLSKNSPAAVAEEFILLFVGPHAPQINPYESYYLTGHLFREPLIALRGFLKPLGLEKQEQEFAEPEDVLAFELDVMRWLIRQQMVAIQTDGEARWLELQAAFLKQHLLVWAPTCAQDMESAQGAFFYRGVAMILHGFLEVEQLLFRDWGLDALPSLEEARERHSARVTWRGPTFDASGEATQAPLQPQEE